MNPVTGMIMNISELKKVIEVCPYKVIEVCPYKVMQYVHIKACQMLTLFIYVWQVAIMEPLDHRNLDKDVQYFADKVR